LVKKNSYTSYNFVGVKTNNAFCRKMSIMHTH